MTKLARALALLACLAALRPAPAAAQYPASDGAVTDLAHVLRPQDADSIRALLTRLRAETGVDARVLVIGSRRDYPTGDADLQRFASRLMDVWGVGDAERKDGALLVVATEDRRTWIALGARYGTEYDAWMQSVMDDDIIPRFRQGDYSGGVLEGARGMVRTFAPGASSAAASESPDGSSPGGGSTPPVRGLYDAGPDAGASAAPEPVYQAAPEPAYDEVAYQPSGPDPARLLETASLGLGLLGLTGLGLYAVTRPRKCRTCNVPMTLVDETSDDVHLDSGQKLEEFLGSVDYRVWKCPGCNQHEIHPSRALFSGLSDCSRCSYRTVRVERETLEHPTYHSTGRERVTRDCKHCHHHDEDIVILPRLTPPPERDESSSSSSAWSSSSSSDSSSSRSSGGGAGGSWSDDSSSSSRSSGRGAGGSW